MSVDYAPDRHSTEEVKKHFGPGSDSRAASELQRRNPVAYSEQKILAVYRDHILPETTLTHSARKTKQQLEEVNERLTADEVVSVPFEICNEYNIPFGTRMTRSKLRRLMGKE